jgi:hypothetical protein
MIAAVPLMIVLRALHIVCGALWFGSSFLFVGFIGPSAAEVGPSAGPLLTAAVKKRKVAKVITGLATVTVLAGWTMWLRDANEVGLNNFVTSSFGIAITIGAALATIAFVVGYFGVGKNVERLVDLGGQIAASGGPPSPEQGAEMDRLGAELRRHGITDQVLLFVAVICMATARYW